MDSIKFIINLDRRPDRLESALERLSQVDIQPIRFPAVDGNKIKGVDPMSTQKAKLKNPADPMTAGAVALTKTTLQILREAQRQQLSRVIIFEDDVGPNFVNENADEWHQRLEQFHANLPETWDLVFYGIEHVMKPENTHLANVVKPTYGYGCHAYAVSQNIYQELIDLLSKHVMELPIDVLYAEFIMPKGTVYAVRPPLFRQGFDEQSDIRVVPKPVYDQWN